jgi:predicted ester cyclase
MQRPSAMDRYLAVWNGEADVGELDAILAPGYLGHMGSRERVASQLREDILAYRERLPGVRFQIEQQFADGARIATRLSAHARAANGDPVTFTGINLSHWVDGRLVEEWALWEAFDLQQ